ncbi:MAG TPA: hypothetical protein VGN57_17925 [Pirellulaceae bacterium]|jgi:hypothetical protein|nr:hypothetical protein [Pirellulaceae bacterium]
MKKFLILPAFVLTAALVGCEPAEPVAPVVDPPTTAPVDGDVDVEPVVVDPVVADPVVGDADPVVDPIEETPAP